MEIQRRVMKLYNQSRFSTLQVQDTDDLLLDEMHGVHVCASVTEEKGQNDRECEKAGADIECIDLN